MVAGTVILFCLSMQPVSNLLVYSLEHKYQTPSEDALSGLDIVVILGGGVKSPNSFRRYAEPSGVTYSRVFNGVRVFKQSSAKLLVLSGSRPQHDGIKEAYVMKKLTIKLGIPEDKIVVEANSRNTMGHAVELAKLFPPDEKRQIGIVTSALHMFRTQIAFRKKFSEDMLVPLPVNYAFLPRNKSFKNLIPSAGAFSTSSYAIHEWIGTVWYLIRY